MDSDSNDSLKSNEDITNTIDYSEFIEKKYTSDLLESIQLTTEHEYNIIPASLINSNILYNALYNYGTYIKSVYYILLKCKINNSEFRDECPCCSKNIMNKFDINNEFIPLNIKINVCIKKFMSMIDLLPCYCNFKIIIDKQTFYKGDYYNFKDTYKLYLEIIPNLILLLNDYYDVNNSSGELKLLPNNRCIHEDIRYNNIKNCIHKNQINNNISDYIVQLNKINNYILKNIKYVLYLFSEQSIQFFKTTLSQPNILNYFKKIYVKQFSVIDLNHVNNGNTIFDILINSSIQIIQLKNIFEILIIELGKTINVNNKIISFILDCIKSKKYELAIELFTFYKYENITYNEDIKYIIQTIFKQELTTEIKYIFLKCIYEKKINCVNLLQIILEDESLIEYLDNSECYEKTCDNLNYEKLLNDCIKQNKKAFLKYFLHKYSKKINNAYINYFSNIQSDNIDILNTITEYNYNINIKINPTTFETGNICLFYYCIKKNLIQSAIILINNDIQLNNLYNGVSLLILCIQTNNYELASHLIFKNQELINVFHENISPVNILLSKMSNSQHYLYLLNNLIQFNTNYTDEYNLHIGFELLKSPLKNHEKLMLFNSIKYKINPLIEWKNPLIIECIIRNEYNIAYIINQNMNNVIYTPLLNHILQNINSNYINIFTFEYQPVIHIINIILIILCINKMNTINIKIKMTEEITDYNDTYTELTNDKLFIKHDDYINNVSLNEISFNSSFN
jgi:hypothetical protein